MAISIFPIGIHSEDVKAVFGSKNNELFVRLISSAIYQRYDEEYSFKRELEDLLYKYVPAEDRVIKPAKFFGLIKGNDGRGLEGEWFDYAFALLILCYELGEQFLSYDEEIKIDDAWSDLSKKLKQLAPAYDLDKLFISKPIFDTPFKEHDEIKVNLLSYAEVHHLKFTLDAFSKMHNEKSNLFIQLHNVVSICDEKKLELIIFIIDKVDD